MPASLRSQWSGIEAPIDGRVVQARFRWNDPADAASDYDRACDLDDYVGILDVGPASAIDLGQDPLPATVQPTEEGLLIARLYTSEVGTPGQLPQIDQLAWTEVGRVEHDGSPLVLFDSTEVGWHEPVFPSLDVGLEAGRYAVEHAAFANDEMELWVVRLRRVESILAAT